jgi:hypothetical protein
MPENLTRVSQKKLKIDKANTTMLVTLAIASFVAVFSLVSIKDLLSQYAYQKRVSSAQETTISDLHQDQSDANQLIASYSSFIAQSPNVLGGSSQGGSGSNSENNAQIILDALPTSEDVPAAVAEIEDIFNSQGLGLNDLTSSSTSTPAPTSSAASSSGSAVADIPFSLSTSGSTQAVESILNALEISIRPLQAQTLTLSGTDSDLQVTIGGQTYYQPSTNLSISSEVVK